MEVKEYCSNKRGEVTSWKAKIYDLMQNLDKRSSGSVEEPSGSIKELGDMVDELERKIGQLETECPANWDKERADIERIISDMVEMWEEAVEMSPDDF
jgi:hypothetical protein